MIFRMRFVFWRHHFCYTMCMCSEMSWFLDHCVYAHPRKKLADVRETTRQIHLCDLQRGTDGQLFNCTT